MNPCLDDGVLCAGSGIGQTAESISHRTHAWFQLSSLRNVFICVNVNVKNISVFLKMLLERPDGDKNVELPDDDKNVELRDDGENVELPDDFEHVELYDDEPITYAMKEWPLDKVQRFLAYGWPSVNHVRQVSEKPLCVVAWFCQPRRELIHFQGEIILGHQLGSKDDFLGTTACSSADIIGARRGGNLGQLPPPGI